MINRLRGIRKRWFAVAASVALLTIGLTGSAVFAANSGAGHVFGNVHFANARVGGHFGNNDTWLNRVAEILGVERTALDSAFATASDEQANTRFEEYVEGLEDDETLTSDQATAANDWFDDRPSNSGPIALRLSGTSDADKVDEFLARLVENEKLTQAESDALDTWHGNRPDSLPEVARKHGRHGDSDADDAGGSETHWGRHGHRG